MFATFSAAHGIAFPIHETHSLGPLGVGLRFDTAGHLIAILCGIGRTQALLGSLSAARRGRKTRAKWEPAKYEVEGEMSIEPPPPARWPCPLGSAASRYAGQVAPSKAVVRRAKSKAVGVASVSPAWKAVIEAAYEPYAFR